MGSLRVHIVVVALTPEGEQVGGLSRTLAEPPVFLPRVGETVDLFGDSDLAAYPDAEVDDVNWSAGLDAVNVVLTLPVTSELESQPWRQVLVDAGWDDWYDRAEPADEVSDSA